MNIKALIKYYIEQSGNNFTSIINIINNKFNRNDTIQNLHKKLKNETIRYYEVNEIANAAGYKLKWIDMNNYDKDKLMNILNDELGNFKYTDVEKIINALGFKLEWIYEKKN